MLCKKCGSEITENDKFCGKCGEKLEKHNESTNNNKSKRIVLGLAVCLSIMIIGGIFAYKEVFFNKENVSLLSKNKKAEIQDSKKFCDSLNDVLNITNDIESKKICIDNALYNEKYNYEMGNIDDKLYTINSSYKVFEVYFSYEIDNRPYNSNAYFDINGNLIKVRLYENTQSCRKGNEIEYYFKDDIVIYCKVINREKDYKENHYYVKDGLVFKNNKIENGKFKERFVSMLDNHGKEEINKNYSTYDNIVKKVIEKAYDVFYEQASSDKFKIASSEKNRNNIELSNLNNYFNFFKGADKNSKIIFNNKEFDITALGVIDAADYVFTDELKTAEERIESMSESTKERYAEKINDLSDKITGLEFFQGNKNELVIKMNCDTMFFSTGEYRDYKNNGVFIIEKTDNNYIIKKVTEHLIGINQLELKYGSNKDMKDILLKTWGYNCGDHRYNGSTELLIFKYKNDKYEMIFNEYLSFYIQAIHYYHYEGDNIHAVSSENEIKFVDNGSSCDILLDITESSGEKVLTKESVLFKFDGGKYVPDKTIYYGRKYTGEFTMRKKNIN